MTDSDIGFEFPPDTSQQWDGFNDSGIEHFTGSPIRSLGREVGQNTSDAATDVDEAPARLEIKRISVATSSIPDVEELKEVVDLCLEHARSRAEEEGEKAVDFFETAKGALEREEIPVLQLADYNTTGVEGPCENGRPYFALMKARGQSQKGSGVLGSFGIGKFAPFAASNVRTKFITTVWAEDSGAMHHYVQGKAILMSHETEDGLTHRGTGFWGVRDQCQPISDDESMLPDWLIRPSSDPSETGTTVNVLGFDPIDDWPKVLGASIAESFFGAIHRNELEVVIQGGPTLKSDTLTDFFADENVHAAIEGQKEEPESFENGGCFLEALSSDQSIVVEADVEHLGKCRVYILVAEGLPRAASVLRNGMLITSYLSGLRRFSEFKEFAAVVECLSEEGNGLLRAMEPPAHDAFEPDRLPDPTKGRVALRKLAKWVREELKKHARQPVSEVTEIDELAEFFPDEEGKRKDPEDGEENPKGKLQLKAHAPPKKRSTTDVDGEDEDEDDDERDDGPGGGGGGGGGRGSKPALPLRNVRAVIVDEKTRKLAFTPDHDGPTFVKVEESGADRNRSIKITSASIGRVENGGVELSCKAAERVSMNIELEREFPGTVRVVAHAV